MKKWMLVLSGLFLSIGLTIAQGTVSGTVIDTNGETVIGASVLVKGTNVGTATDIDGRFTIDVPSGRNTLVFSLIGMITKEATVSPNMRVVMEYDSELLSEVMVVAYGVVKKDQFTGAAAKIDAGEISKLQVSSISKALEGAVPGLQAASASGQPGSDATLRIRGYGSLAAGNNPLIILDGTPFDGSLNSINPQDISSISVLKDATSAALYGSRAANGVIMVTTKRGTSGKPQVSLDVRQGINVRGVSNYNVMTSPEEYLTTYWKALYNDNASIGGSNPGQYASENLMPRLGRYNPYIGVANNQVVDNNGNIVSNFTRRYDDDWEDEAFRTSYRQEYNVSVSGGTDNMTSYLSFGFLGDDGIVKGTSFKRYSVRENLTYNITKNLKLGVNLAYARTDQRLIKSDDNTGAANNMFWFVNNIAPIYPVYMYDLEGNRVTDENGMALYDYGDAVMDGTTGRAYASQQNPIAAGRDDKNKVTEDNFTARGFVEYSFLDGFKFTANLGYDVRNNNRDIFYNNQYGDSKGTGRVQKTRRRYETLTANQLLNYTKTFDSVHNLSALIGHESYSYAMNRVYGEKQNIKLPGRDQFNNATLMSSLSSHIYEKAIESYLSQLLYDYDNKYYFSASLRRDGSSIFHKDNRWGNFWSVGGSWRISQEDFMQSIDWLDNLRLRTSYGTTGNDAILDEDGSYVYRPYDELFQVTSTGGLPQYYMGDRTIKWETNKNFNIGLDLSIFQNRVNLEFDFFIRKATDLLYNKPLPPSEGFSYKPINLGDMKNTGIEFTLSGNIIKTRDFKWDVVFSGTHYKNKITKLPKDRIVSGNSILRVGGTVYDFYLVEYAGVDPENGDALWYYPDPATGEKLTTNDPTIAINDDRTKDGRIVAGTAIPDFTGSLTFSFEYKGFDLSLMSNFQLGGKILDNSYRNLMHAGNAGTNWHTDIRKAWTEDNKHTDVPRLGTTYQNANYNQSTRFLEDADFFNLRNITLGYTFNKNVLNTLKLSGLRVYFAADNVALLSKRKGLDPRQALSTGVENLDRVSGKSDYGYTPISSYSLGLSLNF